MTTEEFKRDILRLQPRMQRTAESIIGDADSPAKDRIFNCLDIDGFDINGLDKNSSSINSLENIIDFGM